MKKINFIVSALAITMLASCGKSTGGYNTNPTTTNTVQPHEHDYNMAGLCSCGDYLGKQLTFDEAYANEVPTLDVTNENKVYFLNWLLYILLTIVCEIISSSTHYEVVVTLNL